MPKKATHWNVIMGGELTRWSDETAMVDELNGCDLSEVVIIEGGERVTLRLAVNRTDTPAPKRPRRTKAEGAADKANGTGDRIKMKTPDGKVTTPSAD